MKLLDTYRDQVVYFDNYFLEAFRYFRTVNLNFEATFQISVFFLAQVDISIEINYSK